MSSRRFGEQTAQYSLFPVLREYLKSPQICFLELARLDPKIRKCLLLAGVVEHLHHGGDFRVNTVLWMYPQPDTPLPSTVGNSMISEYL